MDSLSLPAAARTGRGMATWRSAGTDRATLGKANSIVARVPSSWHDATGYGSTDEEPSHVRIVLMAPANRSGPYDDYVQMPSAVVRPDSVP